MIAEVPPFSLTFWSMAAAVSVLIPVAGARLIRERASLGLEWKRLIVFAALGVVAFKALYYLGIERTTALNASILGPSLPIMVAACAWMVLGERMSGIQLSGAVITLLGVITISVKGSPALLLALDFNHGDLLILAAFAAMAAYTTMLRKVPSTLSPVAFVAVIFVLATIMLMPFYVWELSRGAHDAVPLKHAAAILYIGVVTYLFGIFFWNIAVARLGATLPALSVFLIPVFGTLLAVTFLGERMSWYHYAGIVMTIIGFFLAVARAPERGTPRLQVDESCTLNTGRG